MTEVSIETRDPESQDQCVGVDASMTKIYSHLLGFLESPPTDGCSFLPQYDADMMILRRRQHICVKKSIFLEEGTVKHEKMRKLKSVGQLGWMCAATVGFKKRSRRRDQRWWSEVQ